MFGWRTILSRVWNCDGPWWGESLGRGCPLASIGAIEFRLGLREYQTVVTRHPW